MIELVFKGGFIGRKVISNDYVIWIVLVYVYFCVICGNFVFGVEYFSF